MPRPMIIDTDTASDDAVALMMALMHPDIDVKAITIVAGNVPVKQGSTNARYTAQLCGVDVPVYEGVHKPLVREYYDATWFHGPDGMGGMNYPAPAKPPAAGHAVDALIETIRANPGIILVTLGPLTNVGIALSRAPEIAGNVSRCVVMGGAACAVGNVTPAAEYNIWCDPEATHIVFTSGMNIEMVGWELCRGEANLTEQDIKRCREAINTPLSHFVVDCNIHALKINRDWLGDPGIGLPDPVAMAVAIDPTLATRTSKHYVRVETAGEFTRGMTVVDQLGVAASLDYPVANWRPLVEGKKPNVTVCWELDNKRWKDLLFSLME